MAVTVPVAGEPVLASWGADVASELNRRGLAGFIQLTANSGVVGTTETRLGLDLTYTIVAGRAYRFTTAMRFDQLGGPDRMIVRIKDGYTVATSVALATLDQLTNSAASVSFALSVVRTDLTAGQHTFTVTAGKTFVTGDSKMVAAATSPAQFWIEDLGPVPPTVPLVPAP